MPLSGLLVEVGHLEQQGVGEGTPGQLQGRGILVPVDVTKPQWTANAGTLARLKEPVKLRRPDILDMASSLLDGSGA